MPECSCCPCAKTGAEAVPRQRVKPNRIRGLNKPNREECCFINGFFLSIFGRHSPPCTKAPQEASYQRRFRLTIFFGRPCPKTKERRFTNRRTKNNGD